MPKELVVNASEDNPYYVVNYVTGELIEELKGPTTISYSSDPDLPTKSGLVCTEYKKIRFHFVKFNDVAVHQIEKYRQHIATLSYHTHFADGYIFHGNGKLVVGSAGIAKILHCKSTTAKQVVKYFIDEDILHRRGKGFVMNPYIISRGTSITLELYEEFKNSKWRTVNAEELEQC